MKTKENSPHEFVLVRHTINFFAKKNHILLVILFIFQGDFLYTFFQIRNHKYKPKAENWITTRINFLGKTHHRESFQNG